MSNSSTWKYSSTYCSNSSTNVQVYPSNNCQLQDVKKPTPYYHSQLKTKVLKSTPKTKNIKIIILPKIQCVYINQININAVYNYVNNSSKSQKFIDSKNYGCCFSTIHSNTEKLPVDVSLDNIIKMFVVICGSVKSFDLLIRDFYTAD